MSDDTRSLQDLYKQVILEHSKRPRNEGALDPCTHEATSVNPLCGDRVTLQLRVAGDPRAVVAVRFRARGCAIARASASLLTEHVAGLTVAEARAAARRLRARIGGAEEPSHTPVPETIDALLGVRAFPSRRRCATLAWETLEDALRGDD